VATTDNVNYTATAVLPQGTPAGPVGFAINYKTSTGKDGYPNTATTDGTMLTLVDEADTIKNVTGITTLIDSTVNRPAATTLSITNSLFDGNLGTTSDYRTGSSNLGVGSYITFDFKSGNQATLTGVELAARQDQAARAKGTVVQGSNDNASWTTLTAAAITTQDWQTLPVSGGAPFRYIRVFNGNNWFGNLSEVRFHGTVQGADTTAPATVANAPSEPVSQDTTVTFSATDTGSGVAATYYKVNGGAQQTGASVLLAAGASYTLTYWSVDKAGNTEAARTLTLKIGPPDVSASVQMTQQGATLNRATGKYVGSVTLTNASGAALSGPLQLKLNGLTAGLTLDNASGMDGGAPYVTLAGPLNAGATVSVPLTFTNPARSVVAYTPALYKGNF
jgi:hypothetical protein